VDAKTLLAMFRIQGGSNAKREEIDTREAPESGYGSTVSYKKDSEVFNDEGRVEGPNEGACKGRTVDYGAWGGSRGTDAEYDARAARMEALKSKYDAMRNSKSQGDAKRSKTTGKSAAKISKSKSKRRQG
jgi:hypothetical protein